MKKKISIHSLPVYSPLRYIGGKSRLLPTLMSIFDPEIEELREPFAGAAHFSIAVKQCYPNVNIWFNDNNAELINFWLQAQSNVEALVSEAEKYLDKDGRQVYIYFRDLKPKDDLEWAVKFFVLNRLQYGGCKKSYSGNNFNFTRSSLDRLKNIQPVLRNVKITLGDYFYLLNTPSDRNTFVYLDPPYIGKNHYNKDKFDYEELFLRLSNCEFPWLLSLNETPLSVELCKNYDFNFLNVKVIHNLFVRYKNPKYNKNVEERVNELLIYNHKGEKYVSRAVE